MSVKRIQDTRKSKAIASAAPAPVKRSTLFGPPLLLEGEDASAYDALLAHICAAVNPVDIFDEMFVNDLIVLQWEILRWRRLKSSLIRVRGLEALEAFLRPVLNLYAEDLTEALRENLGEDQTKDFEKLADGWERGEPEADAKVNALLAAAGLSMDDVLNRICDNKAEKLTQSYARREPQAVKQVHELLDAAGRTMDDLMAKALQKKLDFIERIDRLTTTAETRRNASLHEIDRRRAVLGEALRRSVQEVEDAEFKEIETTLGKGKSAA